MWKYLILLSGITLLTINLFGLTQDLRPEGIHPEVLRFGEQDVNMSREMFFENLAQEENESDVEYAKRLTLNIADTIAHVEWEVYPPDVFHQRVPIWENYILYAMGIFTSIPEYERYHFADPYKSVTRGIGICGDASMTLSGLLSERGIENQIITMPGHVMVEATIGTETLLLDADFGVILENGIDFYAQKPEALIQQFQVQLNQVNNGELAIASGLKKKGYQTWNGTRHFITKKYYFEKFSYVMKWLLPTLLCLVSLWLFKKQRKV